MKKQAAFPRTGFWPSQQGGDIDSIRERQIAATEPQDGMTLRDYFAAAALTGMLSHLQAIPKKCVDVSFEIADAMLKAREQ